MDDSEDVFQGVGIIEQYIGITVITAKAVGSACLSLVFIYIYPALGYTLIHPVDVFLAERRKAGSHDVQTLFVRDLFFR